MCVVNQSVASMGNKTVGKKSSESLKRRVAENLAARRAALGWTQEQLAARLDINPETISRYERAGALPSLETLDHLARVLQADVGELIGSAQRDMPDDAKLMASWLDGLSEQDRRFVADLIKIAVRHLKHR